MSQETFLVTGDSVTLTATTAGTARVAVPGPASLTGRSVRFYTASDTQCYWNSGNSSVTAAVATSCPIAPGKVPEAFHIPAGHTHIAIICASGTVDVILTPGQGQ
jgi:hypothetical protein